MIKKYYGLICCIILAFISFELQAQKNSVMFTDITKKAGITFKYTFGDNSYKNIIESSGSGITVFDYNNDGFMDLYLMNGTYLEGISDPEGKVNSNSHNDLYKNNGDGTFSDVTKAAGLWNQQPIEPALARRLALSGPRPHRIGARGQLRKAGVAPDCSTFG